MLMQHFLITFLHFVPKDFTSSRGRHLYAAHPATPVCGNVWISCCCVGSDLKQNKEWGKLPHLWLWERARHTYWGAWWGNSACRAAWLSSDRTPVFLCVVTCRVRRSFATMFLICRLDGVIRTLKFRSESRTTPAFHVGDAERVVWFEQRHFGADRGCVWCFCASGTILLFLEPA